MDIYLICKLIGESRPKYKRDKREEIFIFLMSTVRLSSAVHSYSLGGCHVHCHLYSLISPKEYPHPSNDSTTRQLEEEARELTEEELIVIESKIS
jgi:hypothetical protein